MFGIYITLLSAKVRFMGFRGVIENFFVVVLHRAKKKTCSIKKFSIECRK